MDVSDVEVPFIRDKSRWCLGVSKESIERFNQFVGHLSEKDLEVHAKVFLYMFVNVTRNDKY